MKAKKLTKTQAELWERIRHALPDGIMERCHVGWMEPHRQRGGAYSIGTNLSATVEALAKAGLVEVIKLGGRGPDVVYVLGDVGLPRVEVGPVETHPSRVGPFVTVTFPDLPEFCRRRTFSANAVTSPEPLTADEVAAAFEAAGWDVSRTADAGR